MNVRMFRVLSPVTREKTGKTYWMRCGVGFPNKDGSINLFLDAYPTNGKLQLRDADEERDGRPSRDGEMSSMNGGGASADQLPF